jgi:hypothetical protein
LAHSIHILDALHMHLHVLMCAIPICPTSLMLQRMDTRESTAWP